MSGWSSLFQASRAIASVNMMNEAFPLLKPGSRQATLTVEEEGKLNLPRCLLVIDLTNDLARSPFATPTLNTYLSYLFWSAIGCGLTYRLTQLEELLPKEAISIVKGLRTTILFTAKFSPLILVVHALAAVAFKKSIPHLAFLAFFSLSKAHQMNLFPAPLQQPYQYFSEGVTVFAKLTSDNFMQRIMGIMEVHKLSQKYKWLP